MTAEVPGQQADRPSSGADPGTAEVMAAEQARAAAMVACDAEVLAGLLHEELVYTHATGARHDRAQLLQFLHSGPRFLEVELRAAQCRLHGDAAIVTGELRLRLQRVGDAGPTDALSLASEVWLRDAAAPARWRLVLFQSTRPT